MTNKYHHLGKTIHQIVSEKIEGKPYYRQAQNFKTGFFVGPSIKSTAENYLAEKNQQVITAQLELAEAHIQVSKEEIDKHIESTAKAYSKAKFKGFTRVPRSIAQMTH